MGRSNVKWGIFAVTIACIGCCTIPLLSLMALGSCFAVLGAFTKANGIDILLCLLPLAMILMGYFWYQKCSLKKCCSSPKSECGNKKCSTELQEK